MLRRFNYTGRKKIPRSCISVKTEERDGRPRVFDIKFDLSKLKLPGHGRVYVEAYHRASYMRFDFGKLSDIRVPTDRRLTDIEGGGTCQFRLKIVDETEEHGRVLAEADGLTPLDSDNAQSGRRSILPVVITELGDEVWRVDFNGPQGEPVLELNRSIATVSQIALGDDNFFALVYPAVVRQILHRVLRVEKIVEVDGPRDDWRVQWLKFACGLPGIFPPPKSEDEAADDAASESQLEWIEDAAAAFSARHKTLQRFNEAHSNREE